LAQRRAEADSQLLLAIAERTAGVCRDRAGRGIEEIRPHLYRQRRTAEYLVLRPQRKAIRFQTAEDGSLIARAPCASTY
jgi:hypothetical protein